MKAPLIITVALAFAATASCFSDRTTILEPGGNPCTVPGASISPDHALVLIRGFAFLPDTVRIQRGMSVTWVNCEAASIEAHTSTSDGLWDSNLIDPGASFTRTFDDAGSFSYFCSPHPAMLGVVIVN